MIFCYSRDGETDGEAGWRETRDPGELVRWDAETLKEYRALPTYGNFETPFLLP